MQKNARHGLQWGRSRLREDGRLPRACSPLERKRRKRGEEGRSVDVIPTSLDTHCLGRKMRCSEGEVGLQGPRESDEGGVAAGFSVSDSVVLV
jgi:hypothetical protein